MGFPQERAQYIPPPPGGLRSESTDFAKAARANLDALKDPNATPAERSAKGLEFFRKDRETDWIPPKADRKMGPR